MMGWTFGVVFLVIGVLNALLVHPVPGIFYILLSCIYVPPANALLKKRLHLSVPPVVQLIVGLVILWGTLAVGDLAEILGL